jgi:hypothetical protein
MEWVIRRGNTAIGVRSAIEIVCGRLEYLATKRPDNPRLLIEEALGYARTVRSWVVENEPPPPPRVPKRDTSGKPGPMSDG